MKRPSSKKRATAAGRGSQGRTSAPASRRCDAVKRELLALRAVNDPALAHLALAPLLGELLRRMTRIMSADTAYLALLSEDGLELIVRAAVGEGAPSVLHRAPVGDQLAARVIARRTSMTSRRRTGSYEMPLLTAARVGVAAPLLVEDVPIGVVVVGSARERAFGARDLSILETMAMQAAVAVERSMLAAKLEEHARELEARVEQRTAELADANDDLRAFVGAASHDLKAPLRTISAMTGALREDTAELLPPDAVRLLRRIEHAGTRAWELVDGLLAFGRLRGRDLSMIPIDLDAPVADLLREIDEASASRAAVALAADVARPLGCVLAHPEALRSVLANLLSNARKFVVHGHAPRVRIESKRAGDRITVSVIDEGIGIPADKQSLIFEPLRRLHGVDAYEGSGLGLAIARRAIEKMGGSMGVDSTPGRGSRFWFQLAAAPSASVASSS